MNGLLESLRRLENLEEQVAKLVSLEDLERKRALIKLRREYANNLAELSDAIRSSLMIGDDNPIKSEFQRRLSAVRSKAALHQAEWPAVLADNTADYIDSARGLSRTNSEFCLWARSVISKMG